MKYGIWCDYNDTTWTNGWATSGMLKKIGYDPYEYRDIDGRFLTTDINIAYRYLEILINHHKKSWILEVREKE